MFLVSVLDTDNKLMPCLADACEIEINLIDAFNCLEKRVFFQFLPCDYGYHLLLQTTIDVRLTIVMSWV